MISKCEWEEIFLILAKVIKVTMYKYQVFNEEQCKKMLQISSTKRSISAINHPQ